MIRNTNTKRAIMDLAESFLQDKGFNGFSYAHIAAELGVKNAAIHYHFPSKEELVCAVIRRYRDRFQLWINNSRVKNLSPAEKLDWFFSIYTDARADNGKVCLAGSLETEFNSLPASLREQTKALTRELLAWLQATLQQGLEADVFHFNGDPADKAALILSSLQGGLQMARALGTRKFQTVVEQHKQDLLA
jgi:AcrR family transcriptional regulator